MAKNIIGSVSIAPNGMLYTSGNISNSQSALQGSNFNFNTFSFVFGTGSTLSSGAYQIQDWYLNTLTITASGSYNLTLNGGVDNNPFGTALAFTAIKLIIVSMSTTDFVNNFVQVGPQNTTSAAQLGFGGTGAQAYFTCYGTLVLPGPAAGWTVNSTSASKLPIVNNSSGSLTVQVFVAGV
jgi:hypothetical protein